jgi:hypothetical protein
MTHKRKKKFLFSSVVMEYNEQKPERKATKGTRFKYEKRKYNTRCCPSCSSPLHRHRGVAAMCELRAGERTLRAGEKFAILLSSSRSILYFYNDDDFVEISELFFLVITSMPCRKPLLCNPLTAEQHIFPGRRSFSCRPKKRFNDPRESSNRVKSSKSSNRLFGRSSVSRLRRFSAFFLKGTETTKEENQRTAASHTFRIAVAFSRLCFGLLSENGKENIIFGWNLFTATSNIKLVSPPPRRAGPRSSAMIFSSSSLRVSSQCRRKPLPENYGIT